MTTWISWNIMVSSDRSGVYVGSREKMVPGRQQVRDESVTITMMLKMEGLVVQESTRKL
jgi:hypothetical protein